MSIFSLTECLFDTLSNDEGNRKKNIYRRKWIKNSERKISYCLQFHTLCHFYLVMHPISIAYPFEREKNVFFANIVSSFRTATIPFLVAHSERMNCFINQWYFCRWLLHFSAFIVSYLVSWTQFKWMLHVFETKWKKLPFSFCHKKLFRSSNWQEWFFFFCFFTIVGGFGEIHCDFRTIEIISMNSIEYNSMLLEFFSSFHFIFISSQIWSRNGFSSKDYLHTTSDWIPVRNVMNKISKS